MSGYARPLDEWPAILCGPMLRRVTALSVTVFLAARWPYRLELALFDAAAPDATPIARSPRRQMLRLGANLFVLAIELKPPTPLACGRLYHYDIELFEPSDDSASPETLPLPGLGWLSGACAAREIAYTAGGRPSFALPTSLQDSHLYHGSCRKPNGEGRDALEILDADLAQEHGFPLRRAHQLMLTGDQIYADDVDLALAMTLNETAVLLIGDQEELNWNTTAADETADAVDETDPEGERATSASDHGPVRAKLGDRRARPGQRRALLVGRHTGYSTGEREGHLMFLGEFFAMYLMVFSDALWPRSGGQPALKQLPRRAAKCRDRLYRAASLRRTLAFAQSLAAARRVFANVPTCMIFDDHEVTDDWNANWEWRNAVTGNDLGRRLMRNALLGYAVFQDWGNRPEAYEPGQPHHGLLTAIEAAPADGAPVHAAPDSLHVRLGIDGFTPDAARQLRWDYHIDGSAYRIIALDTHTRRLFPAPTDGGYFPKSPPGLMNSQAMAEQITARAGTGLFPIVISPVPVVGVSGAETALYGLAAGPGDKPEMADREHWTGHRPTYRAVLHALAALGDAVVILSGDVHYGFSFEMCYFDVSLPGKRTRLLQLNSSALKNQGRNPLLATVLDQPARVLHLLPANDVCEAARKLHLAASQTVQERIAHNPGARPVAVLNLLLLEAASRVNQGPIPLHSHMLGLSPPADALTQLVEQFGADVRWNVQAAIDTGQTGSNAGPLAFNRWGNQKLVSLCNIGAITFPVDGRAFHELKFYAALAQLPVLRELRDPEGRTQLVWSSAVVSEMRILPEVAAGDMLVTRHIVSVERPTPAEV